MIKLEMMMKCVNIGPYLPVGRVRLLGGRRVDPQADAPLAWVALERTVLGLPGLPRLPGA